MTANNHILLKITNSFSLLSRKFLMCEQAVFVCRQNEKNPRKSNDFQGLLTDMLAFAGGCLCCFRIQYRDFAVNLKIVFHTHRYSIVDTEPYIGVFGIGVS